MTDLNDRAKAFEAKYAHDEAMAFKATARRNKLFGLWAAGLMGKEGDAAAAYANDVIASDFEEPGDDDVLRKVGGDLEAAGLAQDKSALEAKLAEMLTQAKAQLAEG